MHGLFDAEFFVIFLIEFTAWFIYQGSRDDQVLFTDVGNAIDTS